ncbi:MAG: MoaD/ThiS family protein [Pyrinomonadaceae bacterium]
MRIKVLFFGATAAETGTRELSWDAEEGMMSIDLKNAIFAEYPTLGSKDRQNALHMSVNREYASGDEILSEGDEVALFTAVSGG